MTDHEAPVGECPPECLRLPHVPKPPLGPRPAFLDKLIAAEARIAELEQDKANLQHLLNLTAPDIYEAEGNTITAQTLTGLPLAKSATGGIAPGYNIHRGI